MKITLLYIALLSPCLTRAQLFANDEYKYTSEWIWGINKNTNGGLIGGFMVRFSRSAGDDVFETFGLELSNVKHPSEVRLRSSESGASFTYGKSHHLYAIRFQYGREKLLFRKSNQQGVQISVLASIGPTLGLESPYYLALNDGNHMQFGPTPSSGGLPPPPEVFVGPGKLFQGLEESKLVPGLNVKSSFLFEFGTYRRNVTGIEVGVMVESFTRKIEIVLSQPNKFIYNSIFFTLFWGSRK